jgi:hypothetical protein
VVIRKSVAWFNLKAEQARNCSSAGLAEALTAESRLRAFVEHLSSPERRRLLQIVKSYLRVEKAHALLARIDKKDLAAAITEWAAEQKPTRKRTKNRRQHESIRA